MESPKYCVNVGNSSPDVFDNFPEALKAYENDYEAISIWRDDSESESNDFNLGENLSEDEYEAVMRDRSEDGPEWAEEDRDDVSYWNEIHYNRDEESYYRY